MPVSDPHGTVDPEKQVRHHRHFTKLRNKVDSLQSDISRLGIAISTTWNPNHRHDEEWEKEVDSKMEAIRDSHRFRSFLGREMGTSSSGMLMDMVRPFPCSRMSIDIYPSLQTTSGLFPKLLTRLKK